MCIGDYLAKVDPIVRLAMHAAAYSLLQWAPMARVSSTKRHRRAQWSEYRHEHF